ncbi:MAG: pirin family protein, partial [Chloroflexota bacterium]
DQGSSFNYPIPSGHTTVAYVFEGEADFGVNVDGSGQLVNAVHLIEFDDGDSLEVNTTPDSGVRFMLMAGAPFREPIVPYGPFVMNTPEEIQQALHDLRNGTFVKV